MIWKIPHAHVAELLDRISQVHPDKQVTKAARRALFKARSARALSRWRRSDRRAARQPRSAEANERPPAATGRCVEVVPTGFEPGAPP